MKRSVNLGEHVSTLNNNTSAKHTLQMLRRISGKRKDKTIKYLVTDSDTITNKTDIAETLATSFVTKSSPNHQTNRKIRDRENKNTLDFESDNDKKYNVDFSQRELIKCIDKLSLQNHGAHDQSSHHMVLARP